MPFARSRSAIRSSITILVLGSLSVAAPDVPSEGADASVDDPLSVKIRAEEKTYRQLQAVLVDFKIKPIGIPVGTQWIFTAAYPLSPNLILHVRRDGVDVPATAFGSDRARSPYIRGKLRILDSDQSVVEGQIYVNLLYDMTIPGRYTISLDAALSSSRRGSMPPRARSNEIEVVVQGGPG